MRFTFQKKVIVPFFCDVGCDVNLTDLVFNLTDLVPIDSTILHQNPIDSRPRLATQLLRLSLTRPKLATQPTWYTDVVHQH